MLLTQSYSGVTILYYWWRPRSGTIVDSVLVKCSSQCRRSSANGGVDKMRITPVCEGLWGKHGSPRNVIDCMRTRISPDCEGLWGKYGSTGTWTIIWERGSHRTVNGCREKRISSDCELFSYPFVNGFREMRMHVRWLRLLTNLSSGRTCGLPAAVTSSLENGSREYFLVIDYRPVNSDHWIATLAIDFELGMG
jgi:hypothetical protein